MENTKNNKKAVELPMDNAAQAAPARPWLLPLVSSILVSFTLCVFAPLETYYVTVDELWWPVTQILPVTFLLFVCVFAVAFGLSMLCRGWLRRALCAAYVGISVMAYLQCNYLNIDYGVFNGRDINWYLYGSYGRTNALVWLGVVGLVVAAALLKKKLEGALRFVSVLMTLMLVVSITALGLTTKAPTAMTDYAFTTEGEFSLSSGNNIIVFVVDTLCAPAVEEYLDAHPEQAQKLDGFTQFTHIAGMYGQTRFGMPVMIGNQAYQMSDDYDALLTTMWEESELFNALKQSGYQSCLYTMPVFANSAAAQYAQNAVEQEMEIEDKSLFLKEYAELVLFRYMPHAAKKYVTVNYDALTGNHAGKEQPVFEMDMSDDLAFFEQVRAGSLKADSTEPSFRLYHFRGAHRPYRLTSDGVDVGDGNATDIEQVQDAFFSILGQYFEQLRALGLYDGATIVITADHGDSSLEIPPVLLIKRAGDSGAMRKDTSLVSQLDIAPTIMAAAGLSGSSSTGVDAYRAHTLQNRELTYYHCEWTSHFYEYSVTQDAQGRNNYTPRWKTQTTTGVVDDDSPQAYELGTWVSMTTPEIAAPWLDRLSSVANNGYDGVWLGKKVNRICLKPTTELSGKLTLRFGVFAVNGESRRMQILNEQGIVAEAVITNGDTQVEFELNANDFSGDVFTFRLFFPDSQTHAYKDRSVALTGFEITQAQ